MTSLSAKLGSKGFTNDWMRDDRAGRYRPTRRSAFSTDEREVLDSLRLPSGRAQQAELLQRGDPVVQTDFLGDLAVFDTNHCDSAEPHPAA